MILRRVGRELVFEIPGMAIVGRIALRTPMTGRMIHLTPKERDVLVAMMACYPNLVEYDRMIEYVYPDPNESPEDERGVVGVHVSNIRKKLADWPFGVSRRYRFGYQLTGERHAEDRSRRQSSFDEIPGAQRGLRGIR